MPYSYTGIIYIFSAIVFGFGSYKFYKVWQKQRNFVSKIFACLMGFTSISLFVDGLFGGIIFAENQKLGDFFVNIGFFSNAFANGILGYLAVYLKFPKISPKYGFFLMFFFSIIVAIMNIFYPTQSFLEPSKFINWKFHPLVGSLRSLATLIPCLPIIIAFFQQAKKTTDKRVRIRSFGLGMVFLVNTVSFSADFFASSFAKSNPMLTDLGLAVASFILLLVFILVPTIGEVPYKEKYEISDNN